LLHEWEADDGPPELLPWEIIGGTLSAAQTLRLLTWLHQNELPAPYRLGLDGRYWQTVYAFTLKLLARQLVRPTLVEQRDKQARRYEARRQPILDGASEVRRVMQLAAVWLRALFAADPAVQASAGQMKPFTSGFHAWEPALTIAGDKHYRVALRLEAPAQQKQTRRKEGVSRLAASLPARAGRTTRQGIPRPGQCPHGAGPG
jgi:hypothetical protein